MKLLESIGLVQFFLYEREDLQIGRNTAFFGPNGTGKTAMLDAIQTVMLAADANRTHFNAAGEGKRHARNLRDYCLGVYDQTEEGRCRDSANTYINLVFRDEDTHAVVSAGVSLSASAQSPELTFNGLYLLPGVALSTHAHVEQQGSRTTVLPWRQFQHVAADLCRTEGEGSVPVFTQNREEFTRRLLFALAGPGDRPNAQAVRSAFARSLKLAKDVDDISSTLRTHLIEPYPTNVREFRARLDQFREVRDLIRRLTERIERAGAVSDKYAVVQRERTNEANYECLRAVYNAERLAEAVGEGETQIETLTGDLETARLDRQRAVTEARLANESRDRAIAALNQDPEYRKQAVEAGRLTELENELAHRQGQLTRILKAMAAAVTDAGKLPELEAHRSTCENAILQVADLQRTQAAGQAPEPVAIQSALKPVAAVHDIVRRALGEAESEQKRAQEEEAKAKIALERAGRGLAPLRDSTLTLQQALLDAGIETQPICDLVSIGDEGWQPAVEGYLGAHIEALLVPREQEVHAIDVYRRLKGDRAYGVKLALPSRTREWRSPGEGRFAAQLIKGKNADAVRYLQGELGRVELVESSEDLRRGQKAFSKDGMIASGGGIERRRLPARDELRVGRGDTAAMRKAAETTLARSQEALKAARSTADKLRFALQGLAPFADAVRLQVEVEEQFTAAARSAAEVEELRGALVETQTESLAALKRAKEGSDARVVAARQRETEGEKRVTTLELTLSSTSAQLEVLRQQLDLAGTAERACRQSPLYNPNEVERHRERLDERHGEDWQAKNEACQHAIARAKGTADNADREAWSLFCTYVSDYHLKNHDITGAQWDRAFAFILEDKRRLQDMELAEQMERSEEAYESAVKVFRTDVAQALLAGFDRIDEQMDGLNQVLKNAPEFSNNERYQFRSKVVEQHRPLYDFLRRVREMGGEEQDIFGGSGKLPDEFRALVEGDGNSELLNETSPLNDHRRFFSYDVEIFREGKAIGWLSKRLGPGSGGEHRTPLYVIFGAALAAAYGKTRGDKGGGGLMLLDEAFEKMDPQNVRATAQYLNALGLQMILAGPETDQPKMSSFLDVYYDMARFGSRTIQLEKTVLSAAAKELLQSDNFLGNPALLHSEVERLRAAEAGNVVAG